jgi:hypothetical protein
MCEGSSGEIAFVAAVGAKDVSLESIFAKEIFFVERFVELLMYITLGP